jgi:hypothetical protein
MAATETRDVNNHVLFEVATEVANRGTPPPHRCPSLLPELHADVA